ncbi:MAG: substrate-binding domain-containing protein [Pirellulales bacterium]|nr:substrate-binding domain-containing protein [Pirellulales bacterium]
MEFRLHRSRRGAAQAGLRAILLTAVGAWATYAHSEEKPAVSQLITATVAREGDLLAGIPPYLPKAPVKGKLTLGGSSAMNQLAMLWADGLRHVHPDAQLHIDMYESGQVLPRLASSEMQIGLMSRPLTAEELKTDGIAALAAAKDVLGIVVHPDNPLAALTLEHGVRILRDPEAAGQPAAKTWGDVGVTGAFAKTPVTLYGRSSGTGAWGYLVQRFLGEGAKSRSGQDCKGYAQICEAVAKDPGGVGYLSLALAPPKPGKLLPLVLTTGEVVSPPAPGEEPDPRYPLVRQLYVVLKLKAGETPSPMVEEFLRYVLSRSGQEDAIKAGLLPLRRDEVMASRDQLGWTGVR